VLAYKKGGILPAPKIARNATTKHKKGEFCDLAERLIPCTESFEALLKLFSPNTREMPIKRWGKGGICARAYQ
jgi:hypothetical protein